MSSIREILKHVLIRWLCPVAAMSLAYGVVAKLSLFLAISPGYATAVWPAAGIALAGILIYGKWTLPGIVLGSFSANLWTALDTSGVMALVQSISIPALIGLGATLQALVGALLVRRFTVYSKLLNQERSILKFLILGGPVSCLVSSTVGVTTLFLTGFVPPENYFFNWWTWWIGDAIGVLIFAPLILIWSAPWKEFGLRRRLFVTAPLCMSFAAVLVVFFYTNRFEQEQIKRQLDEWSDNVVQGLNKDLNGYLETLRFLESFYASSEEVTYEEFHQFTRHTLKNHPGIRALSWIPRIPGAERDSYEQSMKSQGYEDVRIKEQDEHKAWVPVLPRPEYFPVSYIEPPLKNHPLSGFDVASDPVRLSAINKARDMGHPVATARIPLILDQQHRFGFALFLPIYKNRTAQDTLEERRLNLRGFVVAWFLLDDMMEWILKDSSMRNLSLRLWDESAPQESRLLYDYGLKGLPSGNQNPWSKEVPVTFAGRQWTLQFIPTQAYFAAHRSLQAWSILTGGFLFTGLLGAFLLIIGRSAVIEELVEQRTKELQRSNEILQHLIRERKKAEDRFRLVVESAPNAMVMVGRDRRIVLVNSEAEILFGYKREELIGQPIELLVPPRFRTNHPARLEAFFLAPRTLFVGAARDLFGLRKDGVEVPVEIGLSPIETTEGSFALAAIIDLTERKKVERMKNEFISTVSHELKTPLTSILGSIGLILGGISGALSSEKSKELLEMAYRNSQRLVRLINDILDIEKMEDSVMNFKMEVLELDSIVPQAIAANRSYGEQMDVRFVLKEPLPRVQVYADNDRLIQVLTNLLSNASKFSSPGDVVEVTMTRSADLVRVAITDHGPGIPEEFHDRIFSKFAQADSSDERQKGGTGLGLYIVKTIVERLGGNIGFETKAGLGTTFYFDLPIRKAEGQVWSTS